MKKLRNKFYLTKAALLLSILAALGFSACDGEDIQPEYGVPVVREKAIKANIIKNDSIISQKTLYLE